MLQNIISKLYLIICLIFIFIWWLKLFWHNNIQTSSILYLMSILIIPFLDIFRQKVQQKIQIIGTIYDWKYKIWIIILSWIGILFFRSFDIFYILMTLYILTSILFLIEERVHLFIAGIFLFFTIIQLIFWNNTWANILSIYCYYFLVLWTIQSIINSKFRKENPETFYILKKYKSTIQTIFYGSFGIYILLFFIFYKIQSTFIIHITLSFYVIYLLFILSSNRLVFQKKNIKF